MKKSFIKTIIFGIIAGLLTCGIFIGNQYIDHVQEKKLLERLLGSSIDGADFSVLPEKTPGATSRVDISGAADCVMPAMVAVNTKTSNTVYDFFGRAYQEEGTAAGSGFIAAQNSGELLIVTNYHVIEGAKSVTVDFVDGTSVKATIKGQEESEDLAVLAVNLKDINVSTYGSIRIATLGQSDNLELGEMVIAIGNALGYGQSTTVGYVSALNREVQIDGKDLNLIQTDVAINQGNSGGALVNMRGEVVGINNAKIADTKVEGVCYAIPISRAIPIIEELMNREVLPEAEQAYIGINGQVVSEERAKIFNMPQGIYIKEVYSDSPAEKAGLKKGNIITKINGKSITDEDSYNSVISYIRGGTSGTVTVMVLENGSYVEKVMDIEFGIKSKK